ncbi:MAG: hypothetical protein AAGI70_00395 [Pseudomonadota bacterium]
MTTEKKPAPEKISEEDLTEVEGGMFSLAGETPLTPAGTDGKFGNWGKTQGKFGNWGKTDGKFGNWGRAEEPSIATPSPATPTLKTDS